MDCKQTFGIRAQDDQLKKSDQLIDLPAVVFVDTAAIVFKLSENFQCFRSKIRLYCSIHFCKRRHFGIYIALFTSTSLRNFLHIWPRLQHLWGLSWIFKGKGKLVEIWS